MRILKKIIGICGTVGLLFGGTTTVAATSTNTPQVVKHEKKVEGNIQEEIIKVDSSEVKKRKILTYFNNNKPKKYKENEVIVKFKKNYSIKSLGSLSTTLGLTTAKELNKEGTHVIKFSKNKKMADVLKEFNASSNVEYVEPNYVYQPTAVTDPLYNELWGLKNTGQEILGQVGKKGIDISAEAAWTNTKGSSSLVIGVIDTGIEINHPELKDKIWVNTEEIPNDGIDNDKNGYIDDVNGWNFYDKNNRLFIRGEEDFHGTHVAGTIAAKANKIGVTGIAPNVKIMPLKFIGPYGGYESDAIAAIEYAKVKGVKILNNSWGGGENSQALKDAIKNSGTLFIAAAGNYAENSDTSPMYPAAYDLPNILSVASINNTGNLSYFSNYGAKSVDVAAPGEGILSTTPSVEGDYSTAYEYLDGTSMATPHVTGVAALVKSAHSSYTPVQIKNAILRTTTKLSSLTGKVVTGGLVNAGKAVNFEVDSDIPGITWKGGSISTSLDASKDKNDVYSIKLLKGEKVKATLTGDSGTDFDLYLYNDTTKTVNSSNGIVAHSEITNSSKESFTFTAPKTGTYYLNAHAFSGAGKYTLSVTEGIGAGTYENTSKYFGYEGTWNKISDGSASASSFTSTNQTGSTVKIVFNGTGISYKAIKNDKQGIVKVTLDGKSANYSLHAATPKYKEEIFSKTGLTAGKHVLSIEWTGQADPVARKTSTEVNVDSISVLK
ncbi:S8 family serine peptidase [Peribacillus simplex]|uniref:Extracellular basic protease n=1 Tax=Peribacillus simplex TaxID=1478 RepID=A0A9W4PH54_9BACI|nr:S8 family serine peptidase [Peribacillus simplex]MDR4928475.1 S8 family serine peptidase [Peribacillus simplex]WHX92221.1 S8 family serine peptidase [Peribacillus simplex]CAH0273236.1 Extracellular basic protease [Peribacillus simplex]